MLISFSIQKAVISALVLATWDIHSQIRRWRQRNFLLLSLSLCERDGSAQKIVNNSFHLR